MPVGYWWTVAVASWGVACALTRWPRLGLFSAIPALVASELPFIVGYWLVASTVLALADGDLGSPGGAAGAVVARPAVRRAGPGAFPRRRLRFRRQAPRGAAADPAPDQPPRVRLRERELPAAAARDPGRAGGRRAPAADARAFAERVRAVSSHPVSYAELPGAYHDFDLYESIRSAAVSQAVEQFTA
jgi:hypothetical protein